jgi:uncharacterized protein (TIGR04141 family)
MKQNRTRHTTLHRLIPRVRASYDSMWNAYTDHVSEEHLAEMGAVVQRIRVAEAPAIWIGVPGVSDRAEWCKDASITTGLDLPFTDCRSSGVLLIGLDDTAYAMSYGAGYVLIPDRLKDRRFGMSFVVRRLNPEQVSDVVRRRPDGRGRTDSTLVAAGAPVWTLGITENAEIIRRIGGRAKDLKTTFGARDARPVNVEGSTGLRTRYAVEPDKLIADIREIERVCREEEPDPAFGFVEHVQPVTDPDTLAALSGELEALLAWDDADLAAEYLVPVVPGSVLKHYHEARSITVKIGSVSTTVPHGTLKLDDILRRTRLQGDGARLAALQKGRVALNSDEDGRQVLACADADHWLEASLSLGPRRFVLLDGEWFEIGADYVRTSRDAIAHLFPAVPSIALPAWSLSSRQAERDYNEFVAARFPDQFLCLDRNQGMRSPLGARSSLEACDLLGPGNELIHVKRASGSAPLSHLFFQGLISAETLMASAAARQQFGSAVAALPRGRVLPEDFRPRKVVYAILLENGKELGADTLFPFSQASLAHAARTLGMYDIDVEVIGIPAA